MVTPLPLAENCRFSLAKPKLFLGRAPVKPTKPTHEARTLFFPSSLGFLLLLLGEPSLRAFVERQTHARGAKTRNSERRNSGRSRREGCSPQSAAGRRRRIPRTLRVDSRVPFGSGSFWGAEMIQRPKKQTCSGFVC